MKLKIWQAGEAVLRQSSRCLSEQEVRSSLIQDLIASMRETMHDAPGVGLAAPQVGLPLQLAVIEDQASYIEKLLPAQARERERRPVPFHAIINPTLILEEEPAIEFFEGCLSVAGFTAIVRRARRVRVECWNERAEPVTIAAEGWYARILQHEIDHLNGILYIDRMQPRSFATHDNHARYWKDKSIAELRAEIGA